MSTYIELDRTELGIDVITSKLDRRSDENLIFIEYLIL